MGQSWSCADIPIRTMAASPDHTHSHTHGYVPAGEFWFLTGGCCGGIYTQSPAAANLAKGLRRPEPGTLLHPVVVGTVVCVTVGQAHSSVSQLLHGSSADSWGLPQLTQQLRVVGPASMVAVLLAAW